jgi:hypothetical protein
MGTCLGSKEVKLSGFTSVILKQLAVLYRYLYVSTCIRVHNFSLIMLEAFIFSDYVFFALDIGRLTNSVVNSASLNVKVVRCYNKNRCRYAR